MTLALISARRTLSLRRRDIPASFRRRDPGFALAAQLDGLLDLNGRRAGDRAGVFLQIRSSGVGAGATLN